MACIMIHHERGIPEAEDCNPPQLEFNEFAAWFPGHLQLGCDQDNNIQAIDRQKNSLGTRLMSLLLCIQETYTRISSHWEYATALGLVYLPDLKQDLNTIVQLLKS